MKIKYFILLTISASALISCEKLPQSELPCGFTQNQWKQRVSWNSQLPVPVIVHGSVPQNYHSSILGAAKQWNDSVGKNLLRLSISSDTSSPSPRKDNRNIIYWMTDWSSSESRTQGTTGVYWVNNQITEADIKINAKNFRYFTDKPKSYDEVNLESLMVHEFGHFLGLKHRESNETVMYPTLMANVFRNIPFDSDKQAIKCEY